MGEIQRVLEQHAKTEEIAMKLTNAEIIAFCHTQGYNGKGDDENSPQDIETEEDFEHEKSFQRKMFAEFDKRKLRRPKEAAARATFPTHRKSAPQVRCSAPVGRDRK